MDALLHKIWDLEEGHHLFNEGISLRPFQGVGFI